MKQLGNPNTTVPVVTSKPYYPESPVLHGIVPNWKTVEFDTFIRHLLVKKTLPSVYIVLH